MTTKVKGHAARVEHVIRGVHAQPKTITETVDRLRLRARCGQAKAEATVEACIAARALVRSGDVLILPQGVPWDALRVRKRVAVELLQAAQLQPATP